LLERQLEQARIGFFDAPFMRIEDVVEPLREVDAIEQVPQAPIGVRHHDELQAAALQRREGRNDIWLHVFPEIVRAVILAQLGECGVRAVILRHAGVLQHEVEIQPAPRAIIGRADDRRLIDFPRRALFGCSQGRGAHRGAVPVERVGDARP